MPVTPPPGIDPDVYAAALAEIRAIPSTPQPAETRKPPTPGDDCGTYGGYRRHRRDDENACTACLHANTLNYANRVRRRP